MKREGAEAHPPLRAVVAVPVKDEQDRLLDCLRAFSLQKEMDGAALCQLSFGVVLLLNNCRDGSAEVARRAEKEFKFPLLVIERELPPRIAHAGGARRLAMDAAAEWLESSPQGKLLLTTDADSRVGSRWIASNMAAVVKGAEAVAGRIKLDPREVEALPDHLHQRGRLEGEYEQRLIEISALIDPRSHNPWPHHATASGATLALTLEAYRRIGGLPQLALGEDRGLVAALELHDARVRFAPDIEVVTSGRLIGRARGGVADTIRTRCENPTALCDENLEPVDTALLRARWRAKARALFHKGGMDAVRPVIAELCSNDDANVPSKAQTFGALWKHVEDRNPRLLRRRLRPIELPCEINRAEEALASLRKLASPQNI